jgi:hypothetical protein
MDAYCGVDVSPAYFHHISVNPMYNKIYFFPLTSFLRHPGFSWILDQSEYIHEHTQYSLSLNPNYVQFIP